MERLGVVIGLAAGLYVGYNWPKIKRAVAPMAGEVGDQVANTVTQGLRYVAEMKELWEDKRAEAKMQQEAAPEPAPMDMAGAATESAAA